MKKNRKKLSGSTLEANKPINVDFTLSRLEYVNRLISEGNLEEAADKTTAIDNGASEASTNVSKNAQTSFGQVINNQSCETGHSTDYDDFSDQEAQAVVEETSSIKQRMKSKERRKLNRENMGKKCSTAAQRKERRKAKRRLNYERSHPRVHIDASQDTDNSLNVTIVQEGGNVINAAYPKRPRRTSNASAKASQPKPKSKPQPQPQSQKNDNGSGETKGIGKTILAIVGLGIFGGVCALIYNKHNRA